MRAALAGIVYSTASRENRERAILGPMKRLVRSALGMGTIVATLGLAIVATTGASAGASYLIMIGLIAIGLAIRLGSERARAHGSKREAAAGLLGDSAC